jgi:two-component system cell cycle response regulator
LAETRRKHRTVLIVDDEEIMRDLLRLHLTTHGYDVLLAEDPVAAGHLVVEEKPDLILVDVEMPDRNGYEFVAALKADPMTRDIPVVFLTTHEDVADQARSLGASAYLHKPVTTTRLLEVLQVLL